MFYVALEVEAWEEVKKTFDEHLKTKVDAKDADAIELSKNLKVHTKSQTV